MMNGLAVCIDKRVGGTQWKKIEEMPTMNQWFYAFLLLLVMLLKEKDEEFQGATPADDSDSDDAYVSDETYGASDLSARDTDSESESE
jgi:hypothetical protein